jgi:Skp family chaperone for outer membrane proteins
LLGKRTQDLAGKLEDFEFRATYTIAQHLHNLKNTKEIQKILQKIHNAMVELSFKNDICIGMKYVFGFFSIFQIFF